jgi:nucleoside-diphosphate-sugar epimerase
VTDADRVAVERSQSVVGAQASSGLWVGVPVSTEPALDSTPTARRTSVLVTGASGFIGLPLTAELARRGAEVHALSRRRSPPPLPGVRWHEADLADGARVQELLGELAPERLVHLAWCMEHGHYWRAPENVAWVEWSLNLVRAFVRQGGRRLLVLGTCAEYDWSSTEEPLRESGSRVAPATLYGVAKDALRRVADTYAEQEGVELAWARPFFLYGPRERPERLVASTVRSLSAGEPVSTGAGARVRDFLHIEDAAGALAALLDSPVTGAVNIASGVGTRVDEVVERLARLLGRPELVRREELPDRPGEPPLLVADTARLREEVGYHPRWELTDGLAATAQWWAEQGAQTLRRS